LLINHTVDILLHFLTTIDRSTTNDIEEKIPRGDNTKTPKPLFPQAYLPLIQGTTDKISRILKKKHNHIVIKPLKTFKNTFNSMKDKIDSFQQQGIYEIPYS
jgi:hypothetical protein